MFGDDNNVEDNNDKSFDKYALRTNVDWKILNRLTTGLGYEYSKKKAKDSSYAKEGYENNNFFVSLNFTLEF